jgi:fatty acid elongase 3
MNFTVLPPLVIIGGGGKIADFSSKTPTMTSIFALLFTGPWNMLDGAWVSVLGYHADNFQFTPGQTPLSTFKETAAMLVIYYSVILGGRNWMRNRPAFKLNTLFLIHNFYLTAISGILLVLFLEQLIPRLWSHGLYDGICGAGGWTDKLVVLYYLNYLTKYLEFVDTCFLFLKKKPLREF